MFLEISDRTRFDKLSKEVGVRFHIVCKTILSSFFIWFFPFHLRVITCRVSSLLCDSSESFELVIVVWIVIGNVRTAWKTWALSLLFDRFCGLLYKCLFCLSLKRVWFICELSFKFFFVNFLGLFFLFFCKLWSFFNWLG